MLETEQSVTITMMFVVSITKLLDYLDLSIYHCESPLLTGDYYHLSLYIGLSKKNTKFPCNDRFVYNFRRTDLPLLAEKSSALIGLFWN